MSLFLKIILPIVVVLILLVAAFLLGVLFRKKVSEREIQSAEEEAKRIVNEAIKSGESKKREALLEAKEEIHKNRTEYEREVKERRSELQKQERRLQQKEENLDKKTEALEKKKDELTAKLGAGGGPAHQAQPARNAREDLRLYRRRGQGLPHKEP